MVLVMIWNVWLWNAFTNIFVGCFNFRLWFMIICLLSESWVNLLPCARLKYRSMQNAWKGGWGWVGWLRETAIPQRPSRSLTAALAIYTIHDSENDVALLLTGKEITRCPAPNVQMRFESSMRSLTSAFPVQPQTGGEVGLCCVQPTVLVTDERRKAPSWTLHPGFLIPGNRC